MSKRNTTEWQRLIDEQAESGLAQKAFFEQAGTGSDPVRFRSVGKG